MNILIGSLLLVIMILLTSIPVSGSVDVNTQFSRQVFISEYGLEFDASGF